MATKLTKKQKGFVKDYIETGIGQVAAERNYDVKDGNTARAIASENLTKPNIIKYLEENAIGASSRIVELSESAKNEAVRLGANKDILDRAGYKAVEKSITLNLEADITNPKAKELAEKYEQELKKNL